MRFFKGLITICFCFFSLIQFPFPVFSAADSSLYFQNGNRSVDVDTDFTLTAMVDPGTNQLNGIELNVSFDPDVLRLNSIDAGNSAFTALLQPAVIDNTAGTGRISLGVPLYGALPITEISEVAKLNFSSLSSAGSSQVGFAGSLIAGVNEADNVLDSQTPGNITVSDPNANQDTTAPGRSNGSPSGQLAAGTTQTNISLQTNEEAICKYSTQSGTPYNQMSNAFTGTYTNTHSTQVTGLTDGSSYTYYVRCIDQNQNVNSSDFTISFSVNHPSDTTAPGRSNGSPSGQLDAGTTQTNISLQTNENAVCRYSTQSGTPYNQMSNVFSTNYATDHSRQITGLSDGTTYRYYVRCIDEHQNANSSDFTISFSVNYPSNDDTGDQNGDTGDNGDQTLNCTDADGDRYIAENYPNYQDCGSICGSDGSWPCLGYNDCDDNNSLVHPGALEICGDGIDQDCSGSDLACSTPTGTVSVDGGSQTVSAREITLRLSAPSNTISMKLSDTNDFTYPKVRPYTSTFDWLLSEGDGVKYVYAWFKDRNGNWTPVDSPAVTTIYLDKEGNSKTGDREDFHLGGLTSVEVNSISHEEAQTTYSRDQLVPLDENSRQLYEKIVFKKTGLTIQNRYSVASFIHYGTPSTRRLGAGERAGVINSYYSSFGKMPKTSEEWQDVIKIANGRWPGKNNPTAEQKAKEVHFQKVYKRAPDMNNVNDNAAVTIIAYGLRPAQRNMESEKNGVNIFKSIYGHHPKEALEWDIVRSIAYSGAVR